MQIRRDPLDILFSRYIRLKAKGICQRYGDYKGYKNLEVAHFHSRRKKSTRWDEDNVIAVCMGCHQYFHENHDEFEAFMKQHLGENEFDLLAGRMRIRGKPDKKLLTLYYQQQIKLLEGGVKNETSH